VPIAQADIVVDASPAEVMAVLVDYAAYPDFLPNIRSVEVMELGPREWRVSYVIRIIRDLQYTLRLVRDGDRSLSWSLMEEGVFLQNSGTWGLTELPDGRTRAEQRLEIQVAVFLPNNIARSLVEHTLPQTLACLRDEIERRKLGTN
jgi:ribosome-associated toxin RatA of RatAB toxin-antitoxin module